MLSKSARTGVVVASVLRRRRYRPDDPVVVVSNRLASSSSSFSSASVLGVPPSHAGRGWDDGPFFGAPASSLLPSVLSGVDDDFDGSPRNRRYVRAAHLTRHRLQQTRSMGRKSGASAFSKPRPPTRKQMKKYRRKLAAIQREKDKHSPHMSKANVRKNFTKMRYDILLDKARGDFEEGELSAEELEYDYGDVLLDDLMGNTSHLTSSPNPKPAYLGHRHEKFDGIVREMMERRRQHRAALPPPPEGPADPSNGEKKQPKAVVATPPPLPSDRLISLLLRSYRDANGTRSKPIGIASALEHLLRTHGLSAELFGERTYTTLLTCARTPSEARRIMKMMEDAQHPISAYSYSILVDVHAKVGDYRGCASVVEEMSREGISPTLSAYTSLLSACYKTSNAGHVPSKLKADANRLAWEKWKEMRIVGLEPDVMAYGAMLRICAARGQPEQAIGLLEEMETFHVKPTTLTFTSALRAVAKSHRNLLLFGGGRSPKNRRREEITKHHGKMARSIVIKAENAEVVQDDGFVSALMLCAAAAGDSATAKAIYLAAEVRRELDHLRVIGGRDHLARIRGEEEATDPRERRRPLGRGDAATAAIERGEGDESGGTAAAALVPAEQRRRRPPALSSHAAFERREYGRDTRPLTALLHSYAESLSPRGLGQLWAGKDNRGCLCENSLRLIATRPKPRYRDNSIPGMTSIEVGMGAMNWEDEPETMGKRLRREKFRGIEVNDDVGNTLDDLDEGLYQMLVNEPAYDVDEQGNRVLDGRTFRAGGTGGPGREGTGGVYFDEEDMAWKRRGGIGPGDGGAKETGAAGNGLAIAEGEGNVDPNIDTGNDERRFDDYDDDERKRTTTMSTNYRPGGDDAYASEIIDPDEEDDAASAASGAKGYYFDEATMQWKASPIRPVLEKEEEGVDAKAAPFDDEEATRGGDDEAPGEGRPFERDERRNGSDVGSDPEKDALESSKPEAAVPPEGSRIASAQPASNDLGDAVLPSSEEAERYDDRVTIPDFESFRRELEEEVECSGSGYSVDEDEAREMYELMKKEYFAGELLPDSDPTKRPPVPEEYAEAYDAPLPDTFEEFYDEMKEEMAESGVGEDDLGIGEAEAKAMFDMVKDHRRSMAPSSSEVSGRPDEGSLDGKIDDEEDDDFDSETAFDVEPDRPADDDDDGFDETAAEPFADDDETAEAMRAETTMRGPEKERAGATAAAALAPGSRSDGSRTRLLERGEEGAGEFGGNPIACWPPMAGNDRGGGASPKELPFAAAGDVGEDELGVARGDDDSNLDPNGGLLDDDDLAEFERALPGLPKKRIRRLRNVFARSLGDPSMLRLIPVLRENMPSYVGPGWLKRKNVSDARVVMAKAEADGVVDEHVLNGMLQVETSAGSLDRAIAFHEDQFRKHGIAPTPYGDRLILQMLVKNNRLTRALAFKEKIEAEGRKLDILAYGSLIEYYGNHRQLGSSLMLLKECIDMHGAPPGEKSLSKIRLMCRKKGIERKVGLVELIGEDPMAWLRHGEKNLKRERSYRGRRQVTLPGNRLVNI